MNPPREHCTSRAQLDEGRSGHVASMRNVFRYANFAVIHGRRQGPGIAPALLRDWYFDGDGVRLRYRDEGAGFAVVLVHGWALDLDIWEPQAAALRADYRVIR